MLPSLLQGMIDRTTKNDITRGHSESVYNRAVLESMRHCSKSLLHSVELSSGAASARQSYCNNSVCFLASVPRCREKEVILPLRLCHISCFIICPTTRDGHLLSQWYNDSTIVVRRIGSWDMSISPYCYFHH